MTPYAATNTAHCRSFRAIEPKAFPELFPTMACTIKSARPTCAPHPAGRQY